MSVKSIHKVDISDYIKYYIISEELPEKAIFKLNLGR